MIVSFYVLTSQRMKAVTDLYRGTMPCYRPSECYIAKMDMVQFIRRCASTAFYSTIVTLCLLITWLDIGVQDRKQYGASYWPAVVILSRLQPMLYIMISVAVSCPSSTGQLRMCADDCYITRRPLSVTAAVLGSVQLECHELTNHRVSVSVSASCC